MRMSKRNGIDHLSVDELEQLLYRKKRSMRRQRLQRLQDEGRVVAVDGLEPPLEQPPPLERPKAVPTGSMRQFGGQINTNGGSEDTAVAQETVDAEKEPQSIGRRVMNKALVVVELLLF